MMFWFMMWFLSFMNIAQANEGLTLHDLSNLREWAAQQNEICTHSQSNQAGMNASVSLVNNYGILNIPGRIVHDAFNDFSQRQLQSAILAWAEEYPEIGSQLTEIAGLVEQLKDMLSDHAQQMDAEARQSLTSYVVPDTHRYNKTLATQSKLCADHVARTEQILKGGQEELILIWNELFATIGLSTLSDETKNTLLEEVQKRFGTIARY